MSETHNRRTDRLCKYSYVHSIVERHLLHTKTEDAPYFGNRESFISQLSEHFQDQIVAFILLK
jgi:hypothetical protein